MERETGGEFPDWEVLHSADAPSLAKTSESLSGDSENFEVIGADSDSEGVTWSNYFSLDDQGRHVKAERECDLSEDGSVESDNPSWLDPGLDGRRNSVGFWSDSGSDRSEERKVIGVDAGTGLAGTEIFKSQASYGETTSECENLKNLDSGDGKYIDLDRKGELGFPEAVNQKDMDELGEIRTRDKDLGEFWSESFGDLAEEPGMRLDDLGGEDGGEKGGSAAKGNISSEEEEEEEAKRDGEAGVEEEKKAAWWKAPLEVLRYCVFRVSPALSFSVAAAVMGFLILGRRLYKLKRKSQSLHLNIAGDDKKVSQFMNGAARLNEAFSVVRRVPMVRPSLPAAGAGITINNWPVMSIR